MKKWTAILLSLSLFFGTYANAENLGIQEMKENPTDKVNEYDIDSYNETVFINYRNAMQNVWRAFLADDAKIRYCELISRLEGA